MRSSKIARKHLSRILASAIALALPSIALAQGQIDAGRANDASNRVGSGGRNVAGLGVSSYSNTIINSGNRIVTGNVTQGREFRGVVQYSDPYAFRGPTAGTAIDNFAKNSVGVPKANAPDPIPNTSVPFYSDSRTVAPPPGFQLNASKTGYVEPPAPTGQRSIQDQRLGIVEFNQAITPMPGTGEMLMRGTLSPQQQAAQQAGFLTASSLYGVREWNPRDPADMAFLQNVASRQNGMNRLNMDPRDLRRMQDELQKSLQPEPLNQQLQPGERPRDSFNINPFGQTFDSPNSPAMVNKPIADRVQAQPITGSGVDTDQGMRFNVIGAARRTSTQYAELNKRLEQYYADRRTTDAEASRKFNEDLRAKQEADKAAAAKRPNPADVTPGGVKPPTPADKTAANDPTKPKVRKPAPMKIDAISAGIKAEGLAGLIKKAETLMKEGKFASSLDQFDAAEAVSPNNPLILLGRANAELGAGFFARADTHLRQAVTTDRSLLMAQYDLTGMLGEERLAKVVAELKELANKDEKKAMPVFLLAYIAYNTGHERQALGYLELAEKRAPEQAAFYKTLKDHWALPDDSSPKPDGGAAPAPATELRKPELNK